MRKLKPDLSYTKLIDIDPDTPKLATTDANDGLTYNLTGVDKTYILWFYLKKNYRNGQILVMNLNHVHMKEIEICLLI